MSEVLFEKLKLCREEFIKCLNFIVKCLPLEAKKKSTLVSGNAGDEKKFIRAAANFFFLTNLIEFLK